MSTDNYQPDDILSFFAAGAITKNLALKVAAGRKVTTCSVAGEQSIGSTFDTVSAAGDDVGVLPGFSFKRITAGAAFNDLDPLAVDAAGKYRTATAGQVVVAIAMELAAGADSTAVVLQLPMGQYRVPAANIAAVVHAFGAADGTIVDVGGAFNQGTLNDNFKELSTKVNAIVAALAAQGVTL